MGYVLCHFLLFDQKKFTTFMQPSHTLQKDANMTVLGAHENQLHFEKEGTIGGIGSQMECLDMPHNLGLKVLSYDILIKQQYLINFFCRMANGFKINFHELVLSRFPH